MAWDAATSGEQINSTSLVVCPRNDFTSLPVADNATKPPILGRRLGIAVSCARKLKCHIVLVTHH